MMSLRGETMKKTMFVVLAVLLLNSFSFGALNAYLRLWGAKQGEIKGGVTQPGREDSIMVIAYSHDLSSPRDASSGLPTGKRQHEPLRITKEIDKSTPLLMNAWADNELMTTFELRFWEPSPAGVERQYYTIILHKARIISIRQEMLNNKYPENMSHKEREHITFVYEGIERIYEDGGIVSEDKWVYEGADILISDLDGNGLVNLLDFAIFASEWLDKAR
jgi:type VI secretion system secreted protein Hcp